MKRKLLLGLWLLAPVAGLAFHYGPGQNGVARDKVADLVKQAEEAAKADEWHAAVEAYTEALAALPPGDPDARAKLEMAKAEARIFDGDTPETIADLQQAISTAESDHASPELIDALRSQLSSTHYYAGWLVRLENVSEEEWKIQCEESRQGFRYLAEKEGKTKDAVPHEKNLESAIRLAQMDLSDLRALPLPKECKNCKGNVTKRLKAQREAQKASKKGKGPQGEKKQEEPKGAGFAEPEDAGS